METEADRASPHQAAPRAAVLYQWVQDHLPESRRGRLALAAAVGLLVVIPSVALLLLPIWVNLSEGRFATLGFTGVFVANIASTATVFIPVPGLTAAGQALINDQGAVQSNVLRVVLLGLVGGTGMALGEVTAYGAGAVGSEVAREGGLEPPRLVRPIIERIINGVNWLMDRFAFVTLAVLSAVPNPAFEIAGITAGAVRMNFWRFMAAVLIGKNARGLLLAFLGYYGVDLLYFT